jgi:diguanylate cyclase (GGDEF)-like protein/PAS domain S-box-containing protein
MKQLIGGQDNAEKRLFPLEFLDANPGPVLIVDADGKITQANVSFEDMTGSSRAQLVGAEFAQYFMPQEDAEQFVRGLFLDQAESSISLIAVGWWGRQIQALCHANLFRFPGDDREHAFIVLQDVTDLRQNEALLRFQSKRDPLTLLLNRIQMRERLASSITRSQESLQKVSLILLDLDSFKDINDAFGHEVGDEVLKYAATVLTDAVNDSVAIGRLGGNEFALVCEGIKDLDEVQQITAGLIEAISKPFSVDSHEIAMSCCVGITLYPMDGENADLMLRNAAIALHRAKLEGGGHFKYFTAQMDHTIRRRLQIANCLRRALNNDEYELHYQPRARLSDGRITGVEALIRWNSDELGLVSPGEFIPVAEQRGLIVPIGEWVVNQACKQAMLWQKQFGKNIKVAVNLSGRQLTEGDLVKVVEQALARYEMPTELLELELTESMLMRNSKRLMETLCSLKDMGVSLAIDDFGTGYSSLSYLKRFPLDYLKIDRSFVIDIPGNDCDEAIAKTIIAMAHSLGLKVIAEGVESYPQLDFLLGYGCDEIQGYLLAKPMSSNYATKFIEHSDVWSGMEMEDSSWSLPATRTAEN